MQNNVDTLDCTNKTSKTSIGTTPSGLFTLQFLLPFQTEYNMTGVFAVLTNRTGQINAIQA
jgi:hypothetical protein